MKTSPGIKALAIIASITLLIPISINWFTFLAHFLSDDNDTPVNPLEYKILTDSTAAVRKCRFSEIENICIPEKVLINGNEYTVTHIGNKAFSYCRKLTDVKIPASITEIEYSAFSGCSSLTDIKLPSNITCINAFTFCECTNLKSIVIPASVTIIWYKAFAGCNNLDVVIDNSKYNVKIEIDAFKGCKSVKYND